MPYKPFTQAKRHSPQRNIIHEPSQNQADQAIAAQRAVPCSEEEIKTQYRTDKGIYNVLRQQIEAFALRGDEQPNDAEHVI